MQAAGGYASFAKSLQALTLTLFLFFCFSLPQIFLISMLVSRARLHSPVTYPAGQVEAFD